MSAMESLGEITRVGERVDVRFERHYPRPVETVWSALTEPARLADWMGAAHVEPRQGGRIEIMTDGPFPMKGEVRIWDPPHVLEFSWSNAHAQDSVVRYELQRAGTGTKMLFTHQGIPYGSSALFSPGWHSYFAALGALLDENAARPEPDAFRKMQAVYVDRYGLKGVALNP
jgi:uncharacterized protein YndB with AHSA1/START domain